MIFHGGFYYYSETRNKRHIFVRRAQTIAGIGQDPGVCVWSAPPRGKNCNNLWAPELHLIDGRWFIYYAADDGENENHRMWVLEAESSDPRGKYRCRGPLERPARRGRSDRHERAQGQANAHPHPLELASQRPLA